MNLIIYSNKDTPDQVLDAIKETEVQTRLTRASGISRAGRFLKGPIPLRDITAAARLPGKSLTLFLAIHHQTALTGKPLVTVPASLLDNLGISRSTKARCLKLLEGAGLVSVVRSKGQAARIKLTKTNIGVNRCGQY
jgi:DNA-binding MarR family transcriptional regulator